MKVPHLKNEASALPDLQDTLPASLPLFPSLKSKVRSFPRAEVTHYLPYPCRGVYVCVCVRERERERDTERERERD
jgi:hypothetical protein